MSVILKVALQLNQYFVAAMNSCFERNDYLPTRNSTCRRSSNICACQVTRCSENPTTDCEKLKPLYPDFTFTRAGPSIMFGFLNIEKSNACFDPKCPNIPSLYLNGLINSKNIDYYALNWLVNRIILFLRLRAEDNECEQTIPICLYDFRFYSRVELISIVKSIMAVDPTIFEQFKCDNIPEPRQNESSSSDDEKCKNGTLHEAYFKYLCKLISQVSEIGRVDIPSDYNVHSILFTGDSVSASGNVGIDMKTEPFTHSLIDNDNESSYSSTEEVPMSPESTQTPVPRIPRMETTTIQHNAEEHGPQEDSEQYQRDEFDSRKLSETEKLSDHNRKVVSSPGNIRNNVAPGISEDQPQSDPVVVTTPSSNEPAGFETVSSSHEKPTVSGEIKDSASFPTQPNVNTGRFIRPAVSFREHLPVNGEASEKVVVSDNGNSLDDLVRNNSEIERPNLESQVPETDKSSNKQNGGLKNFFRREKE